MDDTRIREMLEQHHSSAFGWALHCLGGDREEASDLLQNVYLSILQGKARFEGRSRFRTWLFSVIRRMSWKRRFLPARALLGLRRMAAQDWVGPQSVESRIHNRELRDRFRELLGRLSRRQQEVLHLVFYQEMTLEEASSVMGVSIGSARTHYERGKARLLEELCRSGMDDEYVKGRLEDQAAV